MIDVCIHDTIGMGFDFSKPLGGSETGLILLAQGFKKAGLSVSFDAQECRTLIVVRGSEVPNVPTGRVVIYAADIYDDRYRKHMGLPIQCVSDFQAAWFRSQNYPSVKVIRPILGSHAQKIRVAYHDRWIYPCAVGKGLLETLKAWKANPRGKLVVTTSGYDAPPKGLCEEYGAEYLGLFNPTGLAHEVCMSKGMFYRNVAEECFPMTVAIAKRYGLELDIECVGHDHCGVQEAMQAHDLRTETIVPQWLSFLGLT